MLKDFTSYSSLVPKFLNFVVKFSRLPRVSILWWRVEAKTPLFFYSSVKNDTRTKKRQYSVGNSLLIKSHRKIVKKKDLIPIKQNKTRQLTHQTGHQPTSWEKVFPHDLFRATIFVIVYKISMTWYYSKRHATRSNLQYEVTKQIEVSVFWRRFWKTRAHFQISDTHNPMFCFEEIFWREEITTSNEVRKIKMLN